MAYRRLLVSCVLLLVGLLAQTALAADPILTSAVSRKTHAGVPYDIQLPRTGNPGVECRRVNGAVSVVIYFDQPVTAGNAAIAPSGTVASTSFVDNTMTVNLTGLPNATSFMLTVSGVTSAGGNGGAGTVPFKCYEGDANSNAVVSSGDVNTVKSQVQAPVTGFNFRGDMNMNGSITASDVNITKAKIASATVLPTANTAPTITDIVNQTTNTGSCTVSFGIGDAESLPDALAVKAESDNPTLLPPSSSYSFGGSGATRTLTITSATNQTGTAKVTVTVGDGLLTTIDTFVLTVSATPRLFISMLYPYNLAGVTSQGWGSSQLNLDGDETAATVNLSYSTLTSLPGNIEVRGPSNQVLVNLATITPDSDGNYRWIFPTANAAEYAGYIKNGQEYLLLKTSKYLLNGEIKGTYVSAGSQAYQVPPARPAVSGTITDNDASRFLHQATFGPTDADIASVKSLGYSAWLDKQLDSAQTPPTLVYPIVYQRCTTSSNSADALASDRTMESWWKNSVTANDQLRQRVATALSEIFVVSYFDDNIDNQPAGLATYYDMLVNDAFGNYRTLLKDVTLHPIMGQYLTMRGNVKPTSPNFTAPNENYAREIMQLLSIGLVQLNPDGTPILDSQGQLIPTYDQGVIQGFAHVFTGWNTDSSGVIIPTMTTTGTVNVTSLYNKPMVVNAGNHSTNSKLLLNGFVIPATSSQNTTTANAELDTALDNIFNHPNVGPFICKELIQRLVCSNPSPSYVYRCVQVFNNDGTGVRGNLKAVIKAILTDYEARTNNYFTTNGYGHLREPIVRVANILRSFHGTSNSGWCGMGRTDTEMQQTFLRATTVFNFFEPAYSPPGLISDAGMTAPEFQITSETTTIGALNFLYTGIFSGWKGSDVFNDLTNEATIAQTSTSDLMDRLNLLLMSGQMPSDMRNTITTYVNSLPGTTAADFLKRARVAVHLVVTSPQYSSQR